MDWLVWATVLSTWVPVIWLILHDATGGRFLRLKSRNVTLLICIALVTGLGLAFYMSAELAKYNGFLFFVQTFAGNWDMGGAQQLEPAGLVTTGAIALTLNLGAFGALLSIFKRIGTIEGTETMKMAKLLSVRDTLVRDELYKLLQDKFPERTLAEWKPGIKQAFKTANDTWTKNTLEVLVGKKKSSDVKATLDRDFGSA